MTVFQIKKIMECGSQCHENFEAQLQKLVPARISGVNGHSSITHSNPHLITIAFYDKGKAETVTKKGIVKTKFNDMQKKFTGKVPTKAELENF